MHLKSQFLLFLVIFISVPLFASSDTFHRPSLPRHRNIREIQLQNQARIHRMERSDLIYRTIGLAVGGTMAVLYAGTILLIVKNGLNL